MDGAKRSTTSSSKNNHNKRDALLPKSPNPHTAHNSWLQKIRRHYRPQTPIPTNNPSNDHPPQKLPNNHLKLAPIKQATIHPKLAKHSRPTTMKSVELAQKTDPNKSKKKKSSRYGRRNPPIAAAASASKKTELQSPKFPSHLSHAGGRDVRQRRTAAAHGGGVVRRPGCRRSWLWAKTFVGFFWESWVLDLFAFYANLSGGGMGDYSKKPGGNNNTWKNKGWQIESHY